MNLLMRVFLIILVCISIFVPDSSGSKKSKIPFMPKPDSSGSKKYELVKEDVQKDLSYVKQESIELSHIELSQEDMINVHEEISNMLLLLDYGWQVLDPTRPVGELLKSFALNEEPLPRGFDQVEVRISKWILSFVKKLNLSEKRFCQKIENVDIDSSDFCDIMARYTPFIIYFLTYCLKTASERSDRLVDVDEKSPGYIDAKRIISLLEARISWYLSNIEGDLSFCHGTIFGYSVSPSGVKRVGEQVIKQIKERHKKIDNYKSRTA